MKIKKDNLLFNELLGLEVECYDLNGKKIYEGIVYNETKNTLEIKLENEIKKFLKSSHYFVFKINDEKVKIYGKMLLGRPEDRIKKL